MKRFLFLLLCSITAFPNASSAAEVGSLIESLLQKFGADKVYSKHCVSDCQSLGYTVQASDLNGREDCVACPFDLECDTGKTKSDPQWYNCPKYSCADLDLLDTEPEGVNCLQITSANKPGLQGTCYSCQCSEGTLNIVGCEQKLATLKDSPTTCASLGYRDSITDCENYIACPSDLNKVHCLADTCALDQKGCTQLVELPENATGITQEMTCCNGTTKNVITDFTCNPGYELSNNGTRCEATMCDEGQYSGPDDALKGATYNLKDCSYNMAAGWTKVKVNASSTCYTCKCLLNELNDGSPSNEALALLGEYPYTKSLANENLRDVACDGRHYKKCDCPANQAPKTPDSGVLLFTVSKTSPGYWEWDRPADDDIIAEPKFSSCCVSAAGDEHNYVSGFTCNAANGWVLTEDKTSCEASYCEGKQGDTYYSSDYTNEASCEEMMASSGWTYIAGKSGGRPCGQCKCTATTGNFIESDSENRSLVEYGDPVCDGVHYNTCTLKPSVAENYQKAADFMVAHPNIAPNSFVTVKLCKENYVLKTGTDCNPGYTPDDQGVCKETVCDLEVYNISEARKNELMQDAQANGHRIDFNECQSGDVKYYELTTCGPVTSNHALNNDKSGCCQICDESDGWTVANCGENKTEDKTTTSECGNITCHHCIDTPEEEGNEGGE